MYRICRNRTSAELSMGNIGYLVDAAYHGDYRLVCVWVGVGHILRNQDLTACIDEFEARLDRSMVHGNCDDGVSCGGFVAVKGMYGTAAVADFFLLWTMVM